MNTKKTLTALIAATAMAAGGLAFAQANPPTSTPGAGCTATANAMKGGNLGGSPSTTACNHDAAATKATPVTAAPVNPAPMAASTTTTDTTSSNSTTAGSTSMGNTGAMAPTRVARAARADRN